MCDQPVFSRFCCPYALSLSAVYSASPLSSSCTHCFPSLCALLLSHWKTIIFTFFPFVLVSGFASCYGLFCGRLPHAELVAMFDMHVHVLAGLCFGLQTDQTCSNSSVCGLRVCSVAWFQFVSYWFMNAGQSASQITELCEW